MKKIFENAVWWSGVMMVGLILGVSLQFVRAWTEPAVAPPGGNVGAPINTSTLYQIKAGILGVVGLVTNSFQMTTGAQPGYVLTAQPDPANPAISNGQAAWAAGGGGGDGYNLPDVGVLTVYYAHRPLDGAISGPSLNTWNTVNLSSFGSIPASTKTIYLTVVTRGQSARCRIKIRRNGSSVDPAWASQSFTPSSGADSASSDANIVSIPYNPSDPNIQIYHTCAGRRWDAIVYMGWDGITGSANNYEW